MPEQQVLPLFLAACSIATIGPFFSRAVLLVHNQFFGGHVIQERCLGSSVKVQPANFLFILAKISQGIPRQPISCR
jgi:hypothetical protein